ncbi:RNA-binding protein [Phytophthora megakarya]|uniref:RNA-binding protein n=1 Tax=Phytophthora megakarya TaxID=4795 RepID=A0A225VMS6_9STRA|nr:RNA-binding protein [Phytophthora megakarya]
MAWRPLVARVKNYTREAYVPLRVMLHPEEGEIWGRALGVQGPCTSVVAGKFSDLLEVTDDEIVMKPVEERSQAFQKMEAELKQEGAFPFYQDELYMARTTFSSPTLFNYHRGVGPYFGLSQFATHLNGFVRDKDTGVVSHVWIATRSASKKRWPLMHDTIVGGGLPAGISALENMVKEAQEEAGLEPSWTRKRFVAAGSISYVSKHPYGLTNDTMFIFDVELPTDIAPVNQDGEVESFDLLPVQDVLSRLWSEPKRFKPDVCILLLDFFIRHGILTADNFVDYEELQRELHNTKNPYDVLNLYLTGSETMATKTKANATEETDTRLYVQNLPAYVDSARLRKHFAEQGEVTDACVIRTKDGTKSRRFGFVGFKSATQAEQARKFFNQSFFDTCKINVRVALARESDDMERPWSKYSVGSGRYQKLHPDSGVVKTDEKISTEKKDTKGQKAKEETSGEFQEFMETMQARSKTKFWANDDVQGPVDGKTATKGVDVADAEDSDDEYQELNTIKSDDEDEKKKEKKSKKTEAMSDMDFLRSKMNKNIDKDGDDDMDDAESEAEDDKPTARLFVRNLPFTAVEEDLETLCSTYGPVEEVHMPLDDTRRRKGYGFVLFRTTVDAQTALTALNGMAFQGRRLHVIFARSKPVKLDPEAALADPNLTYKQHPNLTYKQCKELERQIQAQKKTGWNASYIRGDATVGSLAERMGVKRGEIMDKEQGNMAVRLAIGETMLVKENKDFFAREGVDLDAIEGALVKKPNQQQAKKIERSTSVILIKNLPHTTDEEELAQLFRKHGEIGRFLLPPSKTLAVVEFLEPSEARKAFRSLAYKKYQHVPLYLEWAPVKVFDKPASTSSHAKTSASEQKGIKTTSAVVPDVDDDGDTAVGDACHTICVKNLNFSTKEAALEKIFVRCGKLRKVTVARRKDPKRGMLSMGFGFVEYVDAKDTERALQTLHNTVVDGHALNLKLSQKKASAAPKRAAGEVDGEGRKSKIIVRNVAFEATSNEIRELFGAFGQLKRVRMPKKFDGRHRGFAFVEFLTEQEARNAFSALASSHLYGRHLVLEWAEDADDIDTLRAKATRDLTAINDSERRKRMKRQKEDDEDDMDF